MTRERPRFVLTFDLELAWGSVENRQWKTLERSGVFQRTRDVLRRLLVHMDACEIPGVWATVGALLVSPGNRDMSHVPAAAKRGIEELLRTAAPESLDGRDLIDMIVGARTSHMLGCHSYAHIRLGHSGVTCDYVQQDFERFERTRRNGDVWGPVLIFPCNEEGYWDVAVAHGYRYCRASTHVPYRGRGFRRWIDRARRLVATPPTARCELLESGMWRCTDSLLFNTGGRSTLVPWLARRAVRGLRRAAVHGGTYHVWLHPFNLAETPGLLESFQSLLSEAARLRDAGRLEILTFGRDEPPQSVA